MISLSMKKEPPSHKVLIIPSLLMARLSKNYSPFTGYKSKRAIAIGDNILNIPSIVVSLKIVRRICGGTEFIQMRFKL